MLCTKHRYLTLVVLLLAPAFLHSQVAEGPLRLPAPPTHTYQNSADDLRLLLQDVLAAARAGDQAKLMSFVKQMEIPNYEKWFTETFGKEKGENWAQPYGRDLGRNESDFQDRFTWFAKEDGEIVTRSVNDTPDPGNDFESDMVALLQRPVDIYYAGRRKQGAPQGSKDDFIGYFVFVDGRFRWDSTIMPLKIRSAGAGSDTGSQGVWEGEFAGSKNNLPEQSNRVVPLHPGVAHVSPPTCASCPSPLYTNRARALHLEGTVALKATIQPDGKPTDIEVVNAPNPDLAEMAIKGLRKWRFKPAIGPNGAPVAVIVPIEITFRLLQ